MEAVELFNRREFFACHDLLEEVWGETLGEDREFYQGLIHAAVSLHHFEGGNLGGARKMAESTLRYLLPYVTRDMSIDLERFLTDYGECFRELLAAEGSYPTGLTLDESLLPKLQIT
ncbi:MAG: DUF309 domain-containing protein [Planctomycetaceae bacterium]